MQKSFSEWLSWFLAKKNWLWKLKMPITWLFPNKFSYNMSKIPLRNLIWMQKCIEFNCHTMKFHNCHNVHICSVHPMKVWKIINLNPELTFCINFQVIMRIIYWTVFHGHLDKIAFMHFLSFLCETFQFSSVNSFVQG